VERVLGSSPAALRFADGRVQFVRREGSPAAPFDTAVRLPCEALRNPLKLRSCPNEAQREADGFLFLGHGEGHGEGLDLEAAKQSGLNQEQILRRWYDLGRPAAPAPKEQRRPAVRVALESERRRRR
jgi:hypothetical protein